MTSNSRTTLTLTLAAVAMAALVANAEAATVTFLGSDETTATEWRTTTLAKSSTFDPDGDNAYGTDGYYMMPITPPAVAASLPSYIASVADNGSQANHANYPDFDDPTQPIGAAVADVNAGLFFTGNAGLYAIMDFTLAQDAEFVLTIPLVGNSIAHRPSSLSLTQIVGGAATAAATVPTPVGSDDVNYLFFNVDGSTGDKFEIKINGSSTIHAIGGVAFEESMAAVAESAIPEPSSAILVILGLIGLVARRRRRSIRA